ncbi:SDR family oxidoreductase [Gordonia humi]|uniref:NAD(P)-dependent dehydrogenase (Short-subunit alcohol dehydrogenase family) n=1 Tax=Gordonia humi TaxID=686429 RepID=A0A840EVW8_9ACTN|nr:SDR family oxidoreductase [Gordonia humi]MBB4134488.1 NAD(P)-dependent dehydrogenase (short-subunit alcohol dehydrogenase family) [Gordonia humi]
MSETAHTRADLGLAGRTVLVTGGARGVGAGVSDVLQAHGAHVVVCARREPESSVAGRDFVSCDVRDSAAVESMIGGIVERHGRLDGVVNNAGGSPFALAADASDRFTQKILELNLLSPLIVSRAAFAAMREQDGGGAIVNVSSVSGHRPSPGTSAYGAAKAGLDNATTSLAVEWAPAVRLNSVVCGPVQTELSQLHYGDEDGIAAVGRTIPMGRLALPSDVGQAVAFLLSPLASYITGSTLTVHGGGEKPAFLDAANSGNAV